MNISLIAAEGRLGLTVVKEALSRGHHIRVGIRGENYPLSHANLEIVHCDATNSEEVKNLIQNQDVVVSCLGHVKGSLADVQTVATKTVVAAMDDLGIKRFVDLTGTGARFPGDKISLIDRFLNLSVRLIDPSRIKDGIDHMRVLQASDLDWTTIRVLKLQNSAPTPYTLLLHGPTKLYVGREEAAKAMLDVIEEHSYIKQSPIIGSSS